MQASACNMIRIHDLRHAFCSHGKQKPEHHFSKHQAAKAALKIDFPRGVDIDFLEEVADTEIRGNIMIVQPSENEVRSTVSHMPNMQKLVSPGNQESFCMSWSDDQTYACRLTWWAH